MNEIENQKKEQCTEQKREIQKKKKRKYETPKAIFEKYTPDQSISACYNIACEYGMQGGQNGIHAPAEHLLNDILIPGDMRKDDTHSKRNNGSGSDCSQRLKSWGSQNLMENNIHLDMFRLRTNLRN